MLDQLSVQYLKSLLAVVLQMGSVTRTAWRTPLLRASFWKTRTSRSLGLQSFTKRKMSLINFLTSGTTVSVRSMGNDF